MSLHQNSHIIPYTRSTFHGYPWDCSIAVGCAWLLKIFVHLRLSSLPLISLVLANKGVVLEAWTKCHENSHSYFSSRNFITSMVPDTSAYTTVCLMATVLDLMNDHESYTFATGKLHFLVLCSHECYKCNINVRLTHSYRSFWERYFLNVKNCPFSECLAIMSELPYAVLWIKHTEQLG